MFDKFILQKTFQLINFVYSFLSPDKVKLRSKTEVARYAHKHKLDLNMDLFHFSVGALQQQGLGNEKTDVNIKRHRPYQLTSKEGHQRKQMKERVSKEKLEQINDPISGTDKNCFSTDIEQ